MLQAGNRPIVAVCAADPSPVALLLRPVHAGIEPFLRQKIGMGALFDHATGIQHVDPVDMGDG